jgi:peroxiredoxin
MATRHFPPTFPGRRRRWTVRARAVTAGLAATLAALAAPCGAAEPAPPVGFAAVAALELPAADGSTHTLGEPPDAVCRVLCFLGTECPLARLYGPRLDALARDLAPRGVVFLGINANPQDSLADLAAYAERHALTFPVVKDTGQQVAIALGATRTPEVIVVDRTGAVRYRGRIDDQYEPGIARPAPTTHALAAALEDITAGRPVAVPRTEPVGCLIQLPAPSRPTAGTTEVTFARDVRPVLDRHCIECHRPGEIGPFSLVDHDEAAGWGDMILEVIDQGRMPPWHADPAHGAFSNARHMPAADVDVLRRWVAAGMPRGDDADLPPPPPRGGEWDLPRPPDVVVAMADQPYRVPAGGTIDYQYFVVDPGFTEETWVAAVDVAPGNRAVVHHAIVFVRPPDGAEVRSFGLLGAYVPGQRRLVLPPGHAQRVAAGSRLVFQMHYTPTGRPEEDLTRLGLVLAEPTEVTHEVFTIGGLEQDFEIPPGVADHRVEGRMRRLPRDGTLLAVAPHMHLRGRSVRLVARRSADERILLDVPRYDFNWQHTYAFAEPLPLAAVDELGFAMTYDNSAANPANPDPGAFVTWGDQTWEEMAIMFATVARPLGASGTSGAVEDPAVAAARRESIARRAADWADDYIRQLDRDGDGAVSREEAPDAVRLFAFDQLDADRDGVVTYGEVLGRATARFARDR